MLIAMYEAWKEKKTPKRLFFGAAIACLVVAMFQAWRDEYASAEWRGGEIKKLTGLLEGRDGELSNLRNQLAQKDRPLVLHYSPDPEITKLILHQDQELSKLKGEVPSPKKKALQLSNDLLKFLSDRMKAQPEPQRLHSGMTKEEVLKRQDDFQASFVQWMNDTGSEERNKFALRVAVVLQDMQEDKNRCR